jgi:hypothetical protein
MKKKTVLTDFEKKALDQFKSGKSLFGRDGAFAPMMKSFIEKALEAEMEEHLSEDEREEGNKRNGKGRKTVKSSAGRAVHIVIDSWQNNWGLTIQQLAIKFEGRIDLGLGV